MISIMISTIGVACALKRPLLLMEIFNDSGLGFSYCVYGALGLSCFSLAVGFVLRLL